MFCVENLSFYRDTTRILSNINFDLNCSDLLVIKGANGSGKTTLLKIIAGLLQPSFGKILWKGDIPFKEVVNYYPHQLPLQSQLSAYEMVSFWTFILRQPFHKKNILEELDKFKISAYRSIDSLSQGQKKRLFLIFFLMQKSRKIWLFDEIFTHFDQEGVHFLAKMINEHRKDGGIVLLTTHEKIEFKGIKELIL